MRTPSREQPPHAPGLSVPQRIAIGLGVVVIAAAAWLAPVSPLALDRGDVLYGQGHAAAAVAHFERVTAWHPRPAVRAKAALRATTIAAVDAHDPTAARRVLHAMLGDEAIDVEIRADAWERLGELERATFSDATAAAEAFETAWRLQPYDTRAARRLVAAARARTEAGDVERALKAWDRVYQRVPPQQAVAKVAQGSLLLADGDEIAALDAYAEAMRLARDASVLQAARLGAATCRERMGQLDEALVDLDAADLPGDVAAERSRRITERKDAM